MRIIKLKSIDSTNEFCKRRNEDNLIVTAKTQTNGKGTKGRSFVSDRGGLYISLMRRLPDFDGSNTFKIMVGCCVAVCKTVEAFGLSPVIRWANDVLVNGKKICGTLIENTFLSDGSCRSIVGMGINVNNDLPESLKDIATSLKAETGKNISVARVRRKLIENLGRDYTVEDYKSYINWFNRRVILNMNGNVIEAEASDVGCDGRLICKIDGKTQAISSAEVSLRI